MILSNEILQVSQNVNWQKLAKPLRFLNKIKTGHYKNNDILLNFSVCSAINYRSDNDTDVKANIHAHTHAHTNTHITQLFRAAGMLWCVCVWFSHYSIMNIMLFIPCVFLSSSSSSCSWRVRHVSRSLILYFWCRIAFYFRCRTAG